MSVLKTIIIGIFILVFSSCLAACTKQQTPTDSAARSGTSSEAAGVREVVYMYPWFGTLPEGIADVEAAINEITIEKINTRVVLKPVVKSAFSQELSLAFTSQEPVDLITMSEEYLKRLSQNQLMDITELINECGQGILDAVGIFIDGTRREDQIYGVVTMSGMAISPYALFRTDLLEETGISVDDIVPVKGILDMGDTLNTIEQIFARVHELHPDMDILVAGLGDTRLENLICYDGMGDDLGVLMYGEGDNIVNLYDTEEYKQVVQLAKRWHDAGYILPDAALNTSTSGSILLAGNAFCDLPSTQQGVVAQYKQTTGYDFTAIHLMLPLLSTGQSILNVNALPAGCRDPEAAMDFLNLMYTDKDIVNLLAYGVEGKHYVFMADGTVAYPPGVTAATSAYPCIQTWLFGNSLLDYPKVGNVPNLYEIQAQANETAPRSEALGFIYDDTPVKSQVLACQKIVSEYKDGLLSGALDPEKLKEMNNRLKEAGIQVIINEKQQQYKEWIESHGQ